MNVQRFAKIAITITTTAVVVLAACSLVAGHDSGAGGDPVMVFNGRGRAHGVGLCMDGVLYRALEGQSYDTIIRHYYTGVEFSRTDDNRQVRVKCRDGQVRLYSLRDYLYRLAEEPESYPVEGLKVLYVAARTYTLSCIERGKHAADGYDICPSGNCCQAFDENKDISKYPKNCSAVDATSGQVLTCGGKIIVAAYCGSCGGHTENNEDVWGGTPQPYLRGKPCGYCQNSPRYAWTVSMPESEVEARLNSHADSKVGTLYSMDLSSRTPGGRVNRARLFGSLGTAELPGRTLCAYLGFQSSLFDLVTSNFDEYILVLNPNSESVLVTFSFIQPDGSSIDQIKEIAGNSRYSLKVNDYIQFREVSARVVADRPIVAERAMYFDYRGLCGGHASVGVERPSGTWYFAEGYTGEKFDTYILIQNPETQAAEVELKLMVPGGETVEKDVLVAPCSRTTVCLDQIDGLENTEVATVVECANGVEVIAERSMYFEYNGFQGGHNSPGVSGPAEKWYLAEGYTGGKFDTYILLQNPGGKTANVKAEFSKDDGSTVVRTYRVGPHSRHTVAADGVPGLADSSFSTTMTSTNGTGFIVERAMYFDSAGRDGGHNSTGVVNPSKTWYFAEGFTGDEFDTWILVSNPTSKEAEVRADFTKPDCSTVSKDYILGPKSRLTIPVDDVEGLADAEISTIIESLNGVDLIAERAMYFNYTVGNGSRDGGHDAVGVPSPSPVWYFAEGYTGN